MYAYELFFQKSAVYGYELFFQKSGVYGYELFFQKSGVYRYELSCRSLECMGMNCPAEVWSVWV